MGVMVEYIVLNEKVLAKYVFKFGKVKFCGFFFRVLTFLTFNLIFFNMYVLIIRYHTWQHW